jgi:hypothetical protein
MKISTSSKLIKTLNKTLTNLSNHIERKATRSIDVNESLGIYGTKLLNKCFSSNDFDVLNVNLIKLNVYISRFESRACNVSDALTSKGCRLLNESFKLVDEIIEEQKSKEAVA